jgi:hypothetical protein
MIKKFKEKNEIFYFNNYKVIYNFIKVKKLKVYDFKFMDLRKLQLVYKKKNKKIINYFYKNNINFFYFNIIFIRILLKKYLNH